MPIVEFTAQIERFAEGSFTARLVPFGEKAPHNGGTVEFRRGSLRSPGTVPLTVDHGDSVLDRIGVMTSFTETDKGAFGAFQLSDTDAGRTLRTLLLDGAVTDVSVGVRVDSDTDGVMFGELDHVSLVGNGRFGRSDSPSKVLSVHSQSKGAEMPEIETATTEVVEYDDTELKAEIVRLSDELDSFQVVSEPELFTSLGDYVHCLMGIAPESSGRMAKFALATDDTTSGAGAVPDYLSSEYLSIIADSRVFVGSVQSDPIGAAGMSVV
jgi:hypothetical protein